VLAGISLSLDEYWTALTTVPVVAAVLAGFWRWRRHRTETRDCLNGRDRAD
jgi:hypothetical protein